jgi:hypothetical protein
MAESALVAEHQFAIAPETACASRGDKCGNGRLALNVAGTQFGCASTSGGCAGARERSYRGDLHDSSAKRMKPATKPDNLSGINLIPSAAGEPARDGWS